MNKSLIFLFSFIFQIVMVQAASDTVPLNKNPSAVKAVDPSVNDVTNKLKKSSGQAPEPIEGSPEAAMPKPYVASVSTFGSKRINEVILRETVGKEFDTWLSKGLSGEESAEAIEVRLAEKMKSKFGFAFAEFSVVQFFEPGDLAIHVVLDVVEKADVAKRMVFLPEPTKEFTDPDGLIKAWKEYENIALDMVESGEIEPEAQKCQALHCPFGHTHPKLKKFGPLFMDGVKKHIDKLLEIQAEDKRADYRAAATFLVPYFNEGKKIIPGLLERIKDSDPIVRNNALRVLGDIVEFHNEYVVPVPAIVQALSFPKASDRSKAIYVAYLLSINSANAREELLKTAVPSLLELLAAKVPDQKEFSHGTLRKISGKDYAVNDVTSWRNWYAKLNKMPAKRS